MKRNAWTWRGLLLGLACTPLGFGTAEAQSPTTIDIDLVQNATPGTLEVKVRANGDDFGDVLSALTFTIRWATTSPATLGTRVNTCPSGIPITATTQVTNPSHNGNPTGFNYRTYNGFGAALLEDEGCPLPQDTWFTVMTVPVVGNTGCTDFQIVNDAWTTANNRNYFVSLGGTELPGGVIEPTGVPIGNCSFDCPGLGLNIGDACDDGNPDTDNDVVTAACECEGTAGVDCPGLGLNIGDPCNDGDACTTGDAVTAACECAGTFQDTDGDGICNANDDCPTVSGEQGDACSDGNVCTINDVLNASCVCTGTFQDTDGDGTCDANDPCNNNTDGNPCDDGDACTTGDVLDNCVCAGTFQDTDGDGTCDANDPCNNNTDGDACDDGDACTTGDVLDNCVCAGIFQDADGDGTCDASDPCPLLADLENGDPCDDGNANTENDVVTNCICAGTLLGDDCEGVPGGPAQPGTSCDDGNACTINDLYDPNCVCAGTFEDSDGDGICDANDPCDNNTDGDACDDGDACTTGDVLDNCVCAGTFQDADGDGTCDASDPCPLLADLENGDPCDDGNANTENDVVTNCICAGTLIGDDCEGVPGGPAQPGTACDDNDPCTINDIYDPNCVCGGTFQDTDGDGTCDAVDPCDNNTDGDACDDGDACTVNDALDNCVCAGTFEDTDGDGTCDTQDGCPTDPDKIAPGQCGCGFPDTDTDGDGAADCVDVCPLLADLTPGDPCDDGNPNTSGEIIQANCTCGVDPVDDCEGVPGGPALPGTACDDADDCTVSDTWDANCVCAGTFEDTDGDGTCDAVDGCPEDADKIAPGICGCGNPEPGTACDDGNAATGPDAIDANCNCIGPIIGVDCEGTAGGTALPGTACDDEDETTGNDTWSVDCVCVGELIDCLGEPGGDALPGSTCDDGDACTTGDVYDAGCVCAGTFQDADGDGACDANDPCPLLADLINGDPCDDGNAGTENDVVTNCVCVGTPVGGCTENLTLSITLDANGAQNSWTLYAANEVDVVDVGGPYTNGTPGAVVNEPICVPAGCYHLRFSDSGNDGITGGGYVLRDANNKRIIDATMGSFTTTSELGGTGARTFCVPIGGLQILNNWCDRSNLLITSPVYCNSQPGSTGYQWWIYNPHGPYNRRVTTTTNILAPANLNTNPIPTNTWLNIRVRPTFSGGPGEFGPACRIRFVPNTAGPGREILFDEGTSMTMNLYPNPNRDGLVTLSMEGVDVADETMIDIDVYDMLGQRVFAERAVAAEGVVNHRMDLSGHAGTGLYMVNVTIDGQRYTQRLVIQ